MAKSRWYQRWLFSSRQWVRALLTWEEGSLTLLVLAFLGALLLWFFVVTGKP